MLSPVSPEELIYDWYSRYCLNLRWASRENDRKTIRMQAVHLLGTYYCSVIWFRTKSVSPCSSSWWRLAPRHEPRRCCCGCRCGGRRPRSRPAPAWTRTSQRRRGSALLTSDWGQRFESVPKHGPKGFWLRHLYLMVNTKLDIRCNLLSNSDSSKFVSPSILGRGVQSWATRGNLRAKVDIENGWLATLS